MLVLASQHSEVGCGPAALVLSGHLGSAPQGLSFSRCSSSWPFVLGKVGFYLGEGAAEEPLGTDGVSSMACWHPLLSPKAPGTQDGLQSLSGSGGAGWP